jgi:hypothetical protein
VDRRVAIADRIPVANPCAWIRCALHIVGNCGPCHIIGLQGDRAVSISRYTHNAPFHTRQSATCPKMHHVGRFYLVLAC